MPKFGTKNLLLEYFSARILKNYCHIWNQHLRISVIAKFCKETRMPTFGIKNILFGYFFDPKCLIWVFLPKNFRKTIFIFEISNLKFVYLQNFSKCLNSGPKMLDLGVLELEVEYSIVIFEISTLEFV